ncbi:catalase [Duganella sp. FT109W]|uniref:catalase n=1 Tax=Duganella margarita TaxID=2692170 RepID=A0ABW9WFU3_9BURK|nr:catalase [Duganella margarita]MYN39972.1 catalase [Duganella margarita]
MTISSGRQPLLDALTHLGAHAGKRASHARGYCAVGHFAPHANAAHFADIAILRDGPLPATVRFSVGGSDPAISEKTRNLRGMAVRVHGEHESYDMVLVSEPIFYAATPVSYLSYLEAQAADPNTGVPDPQRIAAHEQRHPDTLRLPALLASHAAPSSYACTPYHSTHAFLFTGADGVARPARLMAVPEAGTRYLSAAQERQLPSAFLEREMDERLLQGPIRFQLYAQLPAAGDPLDDPSMPWQGQERVPLGALLITALADTSCDFMTFMPTRLPTGIAASDDPMLRARANVYASASLARRR